MTTTNTISPEAPRCLSEACTILIQDAARRRARLAAQNETAALGNPNRSTVMADEADARPGRHRCLHSPDCQAGRPSEAGDEQ